MIILFGFKGCGKTHLGRLLAKRLALPFIDTDEQMEMLCHRSCSSLYKEEGADFFRRLEALVIASLPRGVDAVVAVGGGAILDPQNRKELEERGTLFYLNVDKATLKERFSSENFSFEKLYATRLPQYQAIPAVEITFG